MRLLICLLLASTVMIPACSETAMKTQPSYEDMLKEGYIATVHVLWNVDRGGSGQTVSIGTRRWTDGVVAITGTIHEVNSDWVVVTRPGRKTDQKTYIPRDKIVLIDLDQKAK